MKFKRKLLFISSLPLCLGAGPSFGIPYTFTSSTVITKLTGNENTSITLMFDPLVPTNYTVVSRLYNHTTNALLFSSTMEETIGKPYTVNYPTRYKLNSSGLRFEYEISYMRIISKLSGVLYPFVAKTINALQYKDEDYVTENAFIKVESTKVVTGEKFNFDNYNEYLSKNEDNSLDFSTAKIYYLHSYDFNYLKAEYHIKDYKDVYPNLKHENDEVVLNVDCVKNGTEISFVINEDLYVKPDSLEMSSSKLSGYIKTDKLFVPINKQKLLEENDSYILIKEAGYSCIDIKLPFTYFFNKKIVGLCYNSDYCISGGIRE
ncbi:MAG: hypothetical protein IJQ72_00185 [Bacilli bacterium]|nr:hypothetical protein [Bacilli bacterium]